MILTLTGASAAGKTTIANQLLSNFKNTKMVVSITTREPRDSDLPGEYQYVDQKEFDGLKERFIWWVSKFGNGYGTKKESIELVKVDPDTIFIMLLVPETVEMLKAEAKRLGIKVVSLYILSPNEEVLRERLKRRGDSDDQIEKRIYDCREWDSRARKTEGLYEGFINNSGTIEEAIYSVLTQLATRRIDIN